MTVLPCRNDLFVQMLNQAGYHPIVLPRSNITPPDIYLFDDDSFIRWGKLATAVPKGSLPKVTVDGALPAFEQKTTSEKSAKGAASFLASALSCLGITGAPKIDLSVAAGKEVTFSFIGTTYREISPAEVSHALLQGFDPAGIPAEKVRIGCIHVAYNYAYATGLHMQIGTREKGAVKLTAAQIEGIVDVGAQAQVALVEGTTISFTSKREPVAFACMVGQVKAKRGGWTFEPKEAPGLNYTGNEGDSRHYLMRKGVVLVVDDMGAD
ncbi:hypothetical protein MPL1032_210082 [Mesorhizobium plurifarium]|uniref:Gasdermin bGSDM n=1 Tax=Mesorhizobium plurifarium TaxID=69974 RepID=A0A0K2VYK4_MESPL|nr:hypothetical protein MPL1032_210082 [Mesorhizobium plurifarium]